LAARQVKLENTSFPLVLARGVFRHSGQLLADALIEHVLGTSPQAHLIFSRFEPVIGALLLGYESIDISINKSLHENLVSSISPSILFET
jgi:hypothetical protein